MRDEFGGSPQDEDETETPEGPPDSALLIAAAGGRREDHPLFPRADGSAETRDIKFVSFCRKRTSDQATQNCPEDIPARDVKSWAQVVEWWGGGEYKAIAKDAKHRIVAWFPNATGDWLTFDGDSKPFVLRNGKGYSTPGAAVAQPTANAAPAAPAPQDALLGMMTQMLNEFRSSRTAAASTPPAADGALVAMIQAQAAQATATSQANTQIMQTLLTVVAQRPTEPTTRPAEPTTLAIQLIGAMQKLVPTPAAAPGLAEQIPVIKALRDLYQPAAAAPANELQPFVDIFGQVMAADAARTQAERAQTATKPQEAPAPRPPPRPRPALVHVPGIGMVEVVAPDAGALRFGDMSTEERAAAIRKDPALLRELGIGLAPAPIAPIAPVAPVAVAPIAAPLVVVAPPSPAPPASHMTSAVVEPVAAITVIPDLEPTPALVVEAMPHVSSSTAPVPPSVVAAAPPVVAAAPPEPAPVVAAPPEPSAPPTATAAPVVAASPEPPASPTAATPSASAPEERPAIALPERMPDPLDPEPLQNAAPDHQRAIGELQRLTLLTHEDRVTALRKLPGIGAMADDVARAMASLPADAVMAMAQTLDLDAIGALASTSNGVAGR
jgi:Meckel syndrome type 1 protein